MVRNIFYILIIIAIAPVALWQLFCILYITYAFFAALLRKPEAKPKPSIPAN